MITLGGVSVGVGGSERGVVVCGTPGVRLLLGCLGAAGSLARTWSLVYVVGGAVEGPGARAATG